MGLWSAALAVSLGCIVGCRSERAAPGGTRTDATASPSAPASNANAIGMPGESIAAVVNPMKLPAYAGPTGSVEGTVLVRGPDAPDVPNLDVRACPAALDTYGKLFRAGSRRADGARPLADAVVVITGYAGYYIPERNDVLLVTIGASCGYPSRSIVLTFGQRLDVANDSRVPFAPYLEGAPRLAVMISPPQRQGPPAQIFPPRADFFRLRDQLQAFVSGDVYVLRQPLHAVTDTLGHFRIDGVPTGKLVVAANLAAVLDQAAKSIDVRTNAVENVELVLTYSPKSGSFDR
jgi:hypothetical protein